MERVKRVAIGRQALWTVFLCATTIPLFALAGCKQWDRMEENQIKLQAMVAANARQLATISSQVHAAQGTLDAGVQQLDEGTREVADQVTGVQNEQREFRNEVAGGNQRLAGQLTQLGEGQESLRDDVTQVADVGQRTAADVTALTSGHAALQQMVQTNQQELTGGIDAVLADQQRIQTGISQLQQTDEDLAGTVAALADKQDALQQTVQNNGNQTADQLATLAAGHNRIHEEIAAVQTLTQAVAANVTGLANEHAALQTAVQSGTQALDNKLAIVEENQQNLQTDVNALSTKVDQTAADLAGMTTSLRETLTANDQNMTSQVADLSEGQQSLQTTVNALSTKVDQTAADLAGMTTSLRETLTANDQNMTSQVADLSEGQQSLQTAVQDLDGKMGTLTADVGEMTAGQTALSAALNTNQDVVVGRLASLSESQANLSGRVDALYERTEAVTAARDSLRQMLQDYHGAVSNQWAELSDWRQALQSQVDVLTATTGQTALDIMTLTSQQDTLREAAQGDDATVSDHMLQLAEAQQQMLGSLDTITATTGQTALDVIAMVTQQNVLREAVEGGNAAVTGQIAQLADGQQQIQSGLDTITATAGQAALDVITLSDNQTRLEQATQTGREELIARLTEIAQGQQNWLQRLDAAQAKVDSLAEGIAAVEQRVNALQGTLQTSMQDLAANLNTDDDRRLQFETKLLQDLQAVLESVSQLRQTQTVLKEQMTQVQRDTRTLPESVEPAVEQAKPQPPSEVKVSDAGTVPPAVVEDAK